MPRQDEEKPESLRIVATRGGYAVFVAPGAQPVAVFTSGFEVLDWVAHQVADWESRRRDAAPPAPDGPAREVEEVEGDGEISADA
jgi:hypothetical protein